MDERGEGGAERREERGGDKEKRVEMREERRGERGRRGERRRSDEGGGNERRGEVRKG